MRSYIQQIEDAYASSKRQGDLMRDRNIERSSGKDRKNRYRDDQYLYPRPPRPFEDHNQNNDQRTDRYGYERSAFYRNDQLRNQHGSMDRYNQYPGSYESCRGGGPKNYKRPDERIKEEIVDRLTEDDYIDASKWKFPFNDAKWC
jgi:hypothetical protein